MEKDKILLDGIITDFYNSVDDRFFYRIKNNWKINASMVFFVLSILYFLVNIIPIIPGSYDKYFFSLFKLIKNNTNWPLVEFNFWIRWGLGSIVSILCLVIAFLFFWHWNKKESEKAIDSKQMTFCYAYTLRKELKSYLINDNPVHLTKSIDYLKKVVKSFVEVKFMNSDERTSIPLNKFREELRNQFEWMQFTEETNNYIDNLSSIPQKVFRRFEQKEKLKEVVSAIDFLTLYEFAKIKPSVSNSEGTEIKNLKNEYFKCFVNEIGKIDEIDEVKNPNERKRNRIISLFQFIINLFSSTNILVLFLSWLILLTLLFVISSIVVVNSLDLKIDSTILIGILTAPFLGAITLAATIYTKNKK